MKQTKSTKNYNALRLGIVGCGAIGSSVGVRLEAECRNTVLVSAVCDRQKQKASALASRLKGKPPVCPLTALIAHSDVVLETASVKDAYSIAHSALAAGKDVVSLSAGGLLAGWKTLLALARKNECRLSVPSGALSGLDGVKAARLGDIKEVCLITRKPLTGIKGAPFLKEQGIDLRGATSELLLFEGSPEEGIERFPQNINVSATLSLALQDTRHVTVRLYTSPHYTRNSHELIITGDFGMIRTYTESVPSEDNPKTSKMAIFSTVAAIAQLVSFHRVGT